MRVDRRNRTMTGRVERGGHRILRRRHMTFPAEAIALYERGLDAWRGGRSPEAGELFRRAFEAGHPGGGHELGMMAVERGDDAAALMWWRRAAEAGFPPSAFEVGASAARAGDA